MPSDTVLLDHLHDLYRGNSPGLVHRTRHGRAATGPANLFNLQTLEIAGNACRVVSVSALWTSTVGTLT
jgi:hypothetical protein